MAAPLPPLAPLGLDADTVPAITWAVMAAGAIVLGLVACFAGARLVRPVLGIAGAAAGALGGWALFPLIGLTEIQGIPGATVGGAVGLIAGAVVGIALFRLAVAVTTGGAIAALALAGGLGWLAGVPGALPPGTFDALPLGPMAIATPDASNPDAVRTPAQWLARAPGVAWQSVRERWLALPGQSRLLLSTLSVGGLLLGLIAGVASPRRFAGLLTAGGGAALACCGLSWLLTRAPASWELPTSPAPWVYIATGVLLGLAGVTVQWSRERAAAPAGAPARA